MSVTGEPGAAGGDRPSWQVPLVVAALVERLPQLVPSAALAALLSVAAARARDPEALAPAAGKVIRIVVRDAGLALTVHCRAARFAPARRVRRADAVIGATLHDFLALAAQREDPDTLFFARRLTLEGDTEAGLAVRNLLDRIDVAPLLRGLERGWRTLAPRRP